MVHDPNPKATNTHQYKPTYSRCEHEAKLQKKMFERVVSRTSKE